MSARNTYSNYIQYLKIKNNSDPHVCAPTAREYDRQYNRALVLSTGGVPEQQQAATILTDLLTVKKNPDVLALLQELRANNTDC